MPLTRVALDLLSTPDGRRWWREAFGEDPPDSALPQTRRPLARATARRGRKARIRGATSGRTDDVVFTSAPDPETARLARFTARLASRQLKGFIPHPSYIKRRYVPSEREAFEPWDAPPIKWFRPDGSGRRGFAEGEGGYIALSTALKGRDLVQVTLHEVRHLGQEGTRHLSGADMDPAAELDADSYAERWAPAFYRAYELSEGRLSRVNLSDRYWPTGHFPHLDILLTRDAKCYQYSARSGWQKMRTS